MSPFGILALLAWGMGMETKMLLKSFVSFNKMKRRRFKSFHLEYSTLSMTKAPALGLTHSRVHSMPPMVGCLKQGEVCKAKGAWHPESLPHPLEDREPSVSCPNNLQLLWTLLMEKYNINQFWVCLFLNITFEYVFYRPMECGPPFGL